MLVLEYLKLLDIYPLNYINVANLLALFPSVHQDFCPVWDFTSLVCRAVVRYYRDSCCNSFWSPRKLWWENTHSRHIQGHYTLKCRKKKAIHSYQSLLKGLFWTHLQIWFQQQTSTLSTNHINYNRSTENQLENVIPISCCILYSDPFLYW